MANTYDNNGHWSGGRADPRTVRMHLLMVLETVARENITKFSADGVKATNIAKCDTSASTFGAAVPRIEHMTGWTGDKIRAHLKEMAATGIVLRHQCRAGGPVRWWPRGLFEKLKKEVRT